MPRKREYKIKSNYVRMRNRISMYNPVLLNILGKCEKVVSDAEENRHFLQFTGNTVWGLRAWGWSANGDKIMDFTPLGRKPIALRIPFGRSRFIKNPVEGESRSVEGTAKLVGDIRTPLVTKMRLDNPPHGAYSTLMSVRIACGSEYQDQLLYLMHAQLRSLLQGSLPSSSDDLPY